MKRLVYMHIDEPVVFFNPILKNCSEERIRVWDDCMSFPDLLVRVFRHRTCDIVYQDMNWDEQVVHLDENLSELLQHECDHLDGILAVSRAIDARSLALVSQKHHLSGV
jgi:peptide deformylase